MLTCCHCIFHGAGAAAAGTIMTLSLWSTQSLEAVAEGAPGACRFFNLYLLNKRDLVVELVYRAERSGYQALVLTVDSPVVGSNVGNRLSADMASLRRHPFT